MSPEHKLLIELATISPSLAKWAAKRLAECWGVEQVKAALAQAVEKAEQS